MAKKPTKPKTSDAPEIVPCEDGGPELLPWILPVPKDARIDFTAWMCRANIRFRLWIQAVPVGPDTLLADESGKSQVTLRLPTLSVGRYQLRWSYLTPSEEWQTRTELAVGDVTLLRRRKSFDGNNPVNMGTLLLEVQP